MGFTGHHHIKAISRPKLFKENFKWHEVRNKGTVIKWSALKYDSSVLTQIETGGVSGVGPDRTAARCLSGSALIALTLTVPIQRLLW